MKRANDLEKLLGGWAAGTLTEAERRALMEAALEDQALFNLLADEQVLKETLEDQALRRRIHAAVQEQPGVWHAIWRRPWTWAAAAGMVVASVLLVAVMQWDRAARQAVPLAAPVQMAEARRTEPAPAATVAKPETPSAQSQPEKLSQAEPQRRRLEQPRQLDLATLRDTGERAAVPPPPALAPPTEVTVPAPSEPAHQKARPVVARGVVGGTPGGVIGGIISPKPSAEKEEKADVEIAAAAPAVPALTGATGAFQGARSPRAPSAVLRQRAESTTRAPAPADLRIRHRILRRAPDGDYVEADTKKSFHENDSLRLAFQVNENAQVSVTTGSAVLWSGIAYQNKEQQVFVPAGTTRLVITASPAPAGEQRLSRASLVAEPPAVAEISLKYE